MNAKHTPGPWRFDDVEFKIKGTDDVNFYTVIANVSPKMDYSRGKNTQWANAKLIAAAPKLLEALKKIRNYFGENDKTVSEHKMFAIVDEAIKEATE